MLQMWLASYLQACIFDSNGVRACLLVANRFLLMELVKNTIAHIALEKDVSAPR